ncbi:hypothetical protein [Rhizobium paknamense]|uniref:Lipoprotein n=1 Tax=Rhizobium paknamense TaxID=1206817 RepID=A0ABU0I893_9HYPH|nr:hypothetical protein [Rhizobium paknamense]MDQ0453818.1 hypothetical protein [Rhizobium paknamense]
MRKILLASALAALSFIAGCKPSAPPPQNRSALQTMEGITMAAAACWFKSGDPAFKPYRMDAELNSFSGQPRVLLVRKGSSDIRPQLVVMAEGQPARLQAFGPLMNEPLSARISTDVKRWATGSRNCQ